MKVGDYVRFNFYRISVPIHISKIIDINYDEQEYINLYGTEDGFILTDSNIIKSSPNIIDLIEVGDYVNGYKVISIGINDNHKNVELYVANQGYDELVLEQDIKSIVTKEQFSQMEYKVGE